MKYFWDYGLSVPLCKICDLIFPLVGYALQVLFEPKQWDYLVDQFKQEFCKLYGMTLEPLLNIYLQAGLSALKTPYPFTDIYLISILLSTFTFNSLISGIECPVSMNIMWKYL